MKFWRKDTRKSDADQLALGKGGSQAIIAVHPTLSSPSEAATKNIPYCALPQTKWVSGNSAKAVALSVCEK